jgi:hypothetical protein
MKNKLIILTILTIVVSFYMYSKKNNSIINKNSIDNLVIENELEDINFCGKNYRIKQVTLNGEDITKKISEISNYNYINDTFPKIGSEDKIYEGMSTTSRNIKYSVRPNAIINNLCSNFESLYTNKELTVSDLKQTISGYTFILGNVLIGIESNSKFKSFSVDLDPNDQSGMSGSYTISM